MVAPAPRSDRLVRVTFGASAFGAFAHKLRRRGLQVVRPSDLGEQVDKCGGEVELVIAKFGRLVIPRERVMIIVPTLSYRHHGHKRVFRRVDKPGINRNVTKRIIHIRLVGTLNESLWIKTENFD